MAQQPLATVPQLSSIRNHCRSLNTHRCNPDKYGDNHMYIKSHAPVLNVRHVDATDAPTLSTDVLMSGASWKNRVQG